MREVLLTMATAVVATIGLAAAPAHATASDVNMSFGMSYGASTTSGTIHFTDGYSATVSGAVHAGSGARRVCVSGENGSAYDNGDCSNWAYAGGPNQPFNIGLRLTVPGGIQRVYVYMFDEDGTNVAQEHCTRNGCTRDW